MRLVLKEGSRKSMREMDRESCAAVKAAVKLAELKRGFKTHSETWWDCELVVVMGHNIYTTSITIQPTFAAMKNSGSNWHNGYAIFSNGAFWSNISKQKVELI